MAAYQDVYALSYATVSRSPTPLDLHAEAWKAMNTLHQFTIAIDKGDSTGFASLFTSDGTLELAKTGQLAKGEAELSAYCTNAW